MNKLLITILLGFLLVPVSANASWAASSSDSKSAGAAALRLPTYKVTKYQDLLLEDNRPKTQKIRSDSALVKQITHARHELNGTSYVDYIIPGHIHP
jgi:hypothetical protein